MARGAERTTHHSRRGCDLKTIEWTDERGWMHRALVRDDDGVTQAMAGIGISLDPPDVDHINWEGVKRDLHNLLVLHKITSWDHIKATNPHFAGVLIKALKKHVIMLFKQQEVE